MPISPRPGGLFPQAAAPALRGADWTPPAEARDRRYCRQQRSHQSRRHQLRARGAREDRHRSEEHTSELQSLMRISYAVFCLKKKKKITQQSTAKKSSIKNNTKYS